MFHKFNFCIHLFELTNKAFVFLSPSSAPNSGNGIQNHDTIEDFSFAVKSQIEWPLPVDLNWPVCLFSSFDSMRMATEMLIFERTVYLSLFFFNVPAGALSDVLEKSIGP